MSCFSKCALLLIAILSIVLCNVVVVFSAAQGPMTTVRVFNLLADDNKGQKINLTLHCKSKNNDLGSKLLPEGSSFEWSFANNVNKPALYSCAISWQNVSGTFVIYDQHRDWGRCQECVWRAEQDGLYQYNGQQGPLILQLHWP
ncbi:S-protein homolog 24-like [Cornus florida]|uniref:S-protein homolog 24-like n=1 Tax=Cornus florida TaxID=4283 RepID=UPI00289FAA01|nr:S-protein homolog 24-like [Cornus florida]